MFFGQVFLWHRVPRKATIDATLDTLDPIFAARVGPALELDLAVVDDDVAVVGLHDCTGNRHALDAESVAEEGIVLAILRIAVVQVLHALNRAPAWLIQDVDSGDPLG